MKEATLGQGKRQKEKRGGGMWKEGRWVILVSDGIM